MTEISSSVVEKHTQECTDSLITVRYQFESLNLSEKDYSTDYFSIFKQKFLF